MDDLIDKLLESLWLQDRLSHNTLQSYRRDLVKVAARLAEGGQDWLSADEKNSIFNPVKVKEYSEFTQSGKENAEKDARESGVFEQSKEVAKKIITDLLNTTKEIKENYKIVFE